MNRSVGKIECLEGLRGFAALVVLMLHLQATFFIGFHQQLQNWLSHSPEVFSFIIIQIVQAFFNGSFAVWLFWGMSALVLSHKNFKAIHLDRTEQANLYLVNAFIRRYPRLLVPVLASVMLSFCLMSLGLMA